MPKIAFVGAGSAVFTRNLVGDILSLPELRDDVEFALMDIDADRLDTAEVLTSRLIAAHGARASVSSTTDRRSALDGADYVVTSFQVGGYKPSTVVDFEVPKRYGLRQTIADTLGIGGIMRGLRTIPVLLDVCRDLEELSPDALLLNYVNPMAMLCWAVAEASPIRTVGLCHSVQGTAAQLADDLGVETLTGEVLAENRRCVDLLIRAGMRFSVASGVLVGVGPVVPTGPVPSSATFAARREGLAATA
jgi:alpha-galactosidase